MILESRKCDQPLGCRSDASQDIFTYWVCNLAEIFSNQSAQAFITLHDTLNYLPLCRPPPSHLPNLGRMPVIHFRPGRRSRAAYPGPRQGNKSINPTDRSLTEVYEKDLDHEVLFVQVDF